jgi:hypothetical protein
MNRLERDFEDVLKRLEGKLLLREFARWLHGNEHYSVEGLEVLLCKPWDGSYPIELLGEDLLVDLGNFLYYMAQFAVEKVYGEGWWHTGRRHVRIVPEPSYEDRTQVYILELETRTVLADGCGHKTWNHNPEELEEDLENLIRELEESKSLLAVRLMADS